MGCHPVNPWLKCSNAREEALKFAARGSAQAHSPLPEHGAQVPVDPLSVAVHLWVAAPRGAVHRSELEQNPHPSDVEPTGDVPTGFFSAQSSHASAELASENLPTGQSRHAVVKSRS